MTSTRTGKPPLTVHIGLGKTGTSVLQQFFFDNRRALRKHGIYYPTYGRKGNAQHLLSPYIPEGFEDSWKFIPAARWAPKLARAGAHTTLISSELISSSKPETALAFCATLKIHFDLRLVVYLRRQDEILMANYNQQVKTGRQRMRLEDVQEGFLPRLDFLQLLTPWIESVGHDNLVVRPYERDQFYRGDIRLDFLHHVFAVEDTDKLQLKTADPNPRLQGKTLEFKRLLNNLVDDPRQAQRLQRLFTRHCSEAESAAGIEPSSRELLPASSRLNIIDRFAASNQTIAKKFLGRDDGLLFLNPRPNIDEPWHDNRLSPEEIAALADFFKSKGPGLMRSLAKAVQSIKDDDTDLRKQSASLLAQELTANTSSNEARGRKLVIHAGTHKTGATALQGYRLAQEQHADIEHISEADNSTSQLMIDAFREDTAGKRQGARDKFQALLEASSKPLAFMSAEAISTFRGSELEDLYRLVQKYVQDIEIIVYIRPVKAYMETLFLEQLKSRGRPLQEKFSLNYMGIARNFDNVFGQENVFFYEECSASESGPSHNGEFQLSLEAVKLLYAYRSQYPGSRPGDEAILRKLSGLGGSEFHFHSTLFKRLLHTGENAAENFAKRAGFAVDTHVDEHDDIGIIDEAQMFDVSQDTVNWLHRQLSLAARLRFRKSHHSDSIARAVASLA